MHEFFIVATIETGGGHFGKGKTLTEAEAALRKAGGKKRAKRIIHRFYSELPFAPFDRPATENEADAWMGKDGSLNWIRCKKVTGETVDA